MTVRDAILDTGLAFHGREPLRKGYSCFGHNSSQNRKVDGRVLLLCGTCNITSFTLRFQLSVKYGRQAEMQMYYITT